jgi:hypothetical protein
MDREGGGGAAFVWALHIPVGDISICGGMQRRGRMKYSWHSVWRLFKSTFNGQLSGLVIGSTRTQAHTDYDPAMGKFKLDSH